MTASGRRLRPDSPIGRLVHGFVEVARQGRRTPATALVALGLVALPYVSSVGWDARIYEQQRVVQVVVLGLAGLVAARQPVTRLALPRGRWSFAALAVVVLGACLSVLLSPVPVVALRHASLTLVVMLCTAAVATETARTGRLPLQAGLLAFAVLAAFTTTVAATVAPSPFRHPTAVVWANPRFLGQAASWTIPVLLGLTVARHGIRRWLLMTLTTAWVALAVFSDSRGAWIAVVGALAVGVVLVGASRRAWSGLAVLAVTVGAPLGRALYGASPGTGRPLEVLVSDDSGRLEILERTFQLWLDRPFFGIGPGGLSRIGGPPTHPHNAPLQLLAEWGAVTTAALTLLLVLFALGQWRTRTRGPGRLDPDPWRVGLTASVLAAAAHSLVSGMLVMPVSQLLLVLVVGGLLGSTAWWRDAATFRPRWMGMFAGGLVVVALATTTIVTRPDPQDLYRPHPRFWLVNPDSFEELE